MKSMLETILREETKTLKTQYIEKSLEWAKNHFNICKERRNWSEVEWCRYFNIEPEVRNKGLVSEFLGFPKGFYGTSHARIQVRIQSEGRRVLSLGLEKFLNKIKEDAELHYESSILKLATRIEKKELNQSNLKVETSHIGVNINTTLTDGEKTVRAFTIVAEGEVQRPHYRYLVK